MKIIPNINNCKDEMSVRGADILILSNNSNKYTKVKVFVGGVLRVTYGKTLHCLFSSEAIRYDMI